MDEIILEANEKMEKTIENLLERFKTIRAGRANPAILDGVKVEYYGTPTPLNQLATISVPEARRLQIKPFDKSCLANIEKAIFEADLGLTPNNTGELIFIAIPELTEDRRREFVKQAKTLAEEAKIALRNIRQDANNAIKKDEEINEIAKKSIYDNKLNKISDNLYLSNRQIEILKRYEIDYKKFNDIKSLMYEVETALEEVYDADDLQALSIELSEFNYYHNTNK